MLCWWNLRDWPERDWHSDRINHDYFRHGWIGTYVCNVSVYEWRAILCWRRTARGKSHITRCEVNKAECEIMVGDVRYHGDGQVPGLSVYLERPEDAASFDAMLSALPERPHRYLTGLTIHPMARQLLRGVNWLALPLTPHDPDDAAPARTMVSVQDLARAADRDVLEVVLRLTS